MDNKCSFILKNGNNCKNKLYLNMRCKKHQYSGIEINYNNLNLPTLGSCGICLEDVNQFKDAGLECKHYYHLDCILQIRNPKCPTCRSELKSKLINKEDIQKIEKRCRDDTNHTNQRLNNEYIRTNYRAPPRRHARTNSGNHFRISHRSRENNMIRDNQLIIDNFNELDLFVILNGLVYVMDTEGITIDDIYF